MRRIERDWIRRIPGYVEGEDEEAEILRRRRVPAPGEEEEGPGEGGEEEQDALAEAEPEAGEESGQVEQESRPGDEREGEGGEPQDAAQGESGEGEPADAEPPELSIPEEVEQARREREEKQRRGAQNLNLAPQAFGLEGRYLRGLAARFARMVSKVAEDSADMPAQGDEEWDLVELRQRRFTGRLISQCRMTREKRKVAVVLDTSPSCEHQARLFASIARVAEELGDCELYDAPNFAIHARKLHPAAGPGHGGEWENLPEAEREWRFQRRVVLAFGDFDGIERISAASAVRGNKIYWFCCEERPSVLEHDREYFLKHFKGHYFPATNLQNLMKAMRKVR
jgi:hypothetical protein